MSNNIDDKKVKVKKRKKEEMSIEDFCKRNNIKLKIDISYEESPEKEIPNKKIKNKNNFQKSLKLDDDYINNNFDNSIKFYKMNSNSSNNISTDDDTKSKEHNKDNKDLIFEKNYINENPSTINNIRTNRDIYIENLVLMGKYSEGFSFGEISLITQSTRNATIKCSEDNNNKKTI